MNDKKQDIPMTQEPNLSNDISLTDLGLIVWKGRRLIIKFMAVFFVIGVLFAFLTPKEWVGQSKVFVESPSSIGIGGDALGGLASLTGISLPSISGDGINPLAFEDILKSDKFIEELLKTKFYLNSIEDSISFDVYCEDHLKKGVVGKLKDIPGGFIKLIKGKGDDQEKPSTENFIFLSEEREKIHDEIKDRIGLDYDAEKSIMSIWFTVQDPFLATQVSLKMVNYLSDYIVDYNIKQDQIKLNFLDEQLEEKRKDFEFKQKELARFRDSNIEISTNAARNQEELLRSRYDLAYSIYSTLLQSQEQVKIELQENRSLIELVSIPKVPNKSAKPNKILMLLISIFLGGGAGIFYWLVKSRLGQSKKD